MIVTLAYGRSGLSLDLPDDVPVSIIEPRFVPGLPDERAAITAALRSPLSSPPLRALVHSRDTVAIVFSDLTRPMPNARVLPPLLCELAEAGVPDDRIMLLNALGTHRPQTEAELNRMLGASIAARFRIVHHDAWDAGRLVEIGRNGLGRPVKVNRAYMEASVRVLTGFIEPHFFAGFSGGPKAVLPGLADAAAITDGPFTGCADIDWRAAAHHALGNALVIGRLIVGGEAGDGQDSGRPRAKGPRRAWRQGKVAVV